MADFEQTVSNTLNVFGASPSSKWGEMTWGVDNWGDGSKDLTCDIEKLISNSQSLDSAVSKLSDKQISNSLTVDSETTYEDLRDGQGYYYQFIKPTSNAEERQITSWTDVAEDTESWTSSAVGSTTWSES